MSMRRRSLFVALAMLGAALAAGAPASAQRDEKFSYWPSGTGAWSGSTVGLYFAEAMDTASVESAFGLQPLESGTYAWSEGNRRVEFRPDEPLRALTRYTVTVGTGARTSSGQAVFDRPLSWTFDTSADTAQTRFGYSIPVQFAPTSGKPGVHVYPGYPRITLDFALYSLDVAGFAAAYPELADGDEDMRIDTAGLAKVATWSTHLAEDYYSEISFPSGTPAGLYVIDARSARTGPAQAIVIYADYAMVAKAGADGRTFWVTRMPAAEPVAGAGVILRDAAGTAMAAEPTDQDGIVTFSDGTGALFATAQIDGQTTLVVMDQNWISGSYYWRWWGQYTAAPPEYAGHVHTDRPIYRPGHTVHYKASLRHIERDGYSVVDASTPVTVTVKDNQGNTVSTSQPTPDAFGSIAGDFRLGSDVGLGAWSIEVGIGRQVFAGSFQVQEYVKPDYEVAVTTDRPYYVRGDLATVKVQARYYFGQPASGATVTLRVFRGYYYWYSRSGQQVGEYHGTLDADGLWSGRVPLEGNGDYAETYFFEAEVIDANRRPVVQEAAAQVHPAAFTLSLTSDRYGVEVGQPVVFTAATIDHDGLPVAGREVSLEITGYYREGQSVIRRERAVTGPDGTATIRLLDMKEGWYGVQGFATDDAGRQVRDWSYAWLYSTRYPWYWWGGLEITADRDSYRPGDTARLLIKSPVKGTALVTLQREDVHDSLVVAVDGATTIEVPIKDEYAPNMWATVHMWDARDEARGIADAKLVSASVNLVVPAERERLAVTIAPDAAQHRPREEATFTVSVRDAEGGPVEAQLSFALVDKAVLALAEDASGDIFDAFWSSRDSRVGTYDTIATEEGTYRGAPDLRPQPGAGEGEDANKGADQQSDTSPRREFPDTAFWKADLVTDRSGEARVTLTLPDSLTTWVAFARAITKDTRAGQGKAELLVTKPIIADPAMPRFAVQGDEFALDVLARNYTADTVQGSCSLESPGLVQLDPGTRTLALPVAETHVARWSVVASKLGEGLVTARLDTPAGADAIELPLPVLPFAVPDRFVRSGSTNGSVDEAFDVPFNAIPDSSTVEIRLAPSVALGVLDGLEELIGYPYGCIEQTMSRMMPNAVIGRLVTELDIRAPEITEKLPDMMAMGLQKVYGYQNADGSWGWWRSEGNLYISAYVLHGLLLTRDNGYDVDPDVLAKGFGYLATQLPVEQDVRMRAYAVYVMALGERDDAKANAESLFDRRAGMDAFAISSLAIALEKVGRGDLAQRVVDDLVAMAAETPTGASWPVQEPDWRHWDYYYWRTMASTDKQTAMALEALALLRPTSPLAPKAARWLMENRTGWSGGWSSTQATTFAILALTDYIVASGELWSEFDWSVRLDGRLVAQGRVDASNVKERMRPIVLAGADLPPGPHTLAIAREGRGSLFYTVIGRMAEYYDGFEPTAAEGFGMTITREYLPANGRGDFSGWHVGDVVNVRLTLNTTDDLHYMIIEDMLPAGFEALNEQLATETTRIPSEPKDRWYWWGYERKEVRDQKVSFFATYLPRGERVFDYAVRVVTPGVFSARPAEAYAMYRPEVWGRSASERVSIDPERVVDRPLLGGDFDRDCRLTTFDASLVAEAWPYGTHRDVNGDARLDVADIATAGGRAGLVCGDSVPLPPGAAGDVALVLTAPDAVREGDTFELEVRLDGHGNVGAFETTLQWPSGALEIVRTDVNELLTGAAALVQPLGDGLRIGAYVADGADLDGVAAVARITLRAARSGSSEIHVTRAQVVTDEGGEYRVTSNGTVVSPEPWRPVGRAVLPLVHTGRAATE